MIDYIILYDMILYYIIEIVSIQPLAVIRNKIICFVLFVCIDIHIYVFQS